MKEYGKIVGLKITKDGIEPDEGCIEALTGALESRPKSQKQMRRLIGIILYSSGAFEWSEDDLTWWSRVMKPLHEAACKEKYPGWTEDCERSAMELKEEMTALPKAHTRPEDLITDDSCLVIMSDACDEGVGAGLWRVMKPDASTVTIEDLKDRSMSRLIATDAKILSKQEQEWFTFEHEIYGMVHAVSKWSRLLSITTLQLTLVTGSG